MKIDRTTGAAIVALAWTLLGAYGCTNANSDPRLKTRGAADIRTHAAAPPTSKPAETSLQRPSPDRYAGMISGSLFSAPQPTPIMAPKPTAPAPTKPIVPPPPPASDPLADAVYAGSVTINGRTMALIESRATRRGVYVGAGDQWNGLSIIDVTPQNITFSVEGAPRLLAMSTTINVVPLSGGTGGGGTVPAPGASNGGGAPQMPPSPSMMQAMPMQLQMLNYSTGVERFSEVQSLFSRMSGEAPVSVEIR